MSISKIPEKVRYLLWAKSAGRCQFDGCNAPLWRDDLTQIEMNFADVAHIIGDRPGGPRGHVELSQEYCDDIDNLMLLCPIHHREIDTLYDDWTENDLRTMKRRHEFRIELATGLLPNKKSHVIIYRSNVGKENPKINIKEAMSAMFPDWYPESRYPIRLGTENSPIHDDEPAYWHLEESNLIRQFEQSVRPVLVAPGNHHFSIFALAPQPLLIRFGTLLPDLYRAIVYQPHRTAEKRWHWQEEPEDFAFTCQAPESSYRLVALIMALSAPITDQRVEAALDNQEFSIWRFSRLPFAGADTDFLKGPNQLRMFREHFRQTLDAIKEKHGQDAEIHVFPAVPVSIAIEMGRVWQSKTDLPMVIYDENRQRSGFRKALEIKVNTDATRTD